MYSELEAKVGWRLLRPKGNAFLEEKISRQITANGAVFRDVYERESPPQILITTTQQLATASIPHDGEFTETMQIGNFSVAIVPATSRAGAEARFETGAVSSTDGTPIVEIVAAGDVQTIYDFIASLTFGNSANNGS